MNILDILNDENKILNCIDTGDELWLNYTNLKQKLSKQRACSPSPKKFNLFPFAGKVMLVAFRDSRGVILAHFLPKSQSVTVRYYVFRSN